MNVQTKNTLIQVCELPCQQWQESRRRVYSSIGLTPTLCGIGRGGQYRTQDFNEENLWTTK